MVKRAEETAKRLHYFESVYKEFEIKMAEPETMEQLDQAIALIEGSKKKASNQLFYEIESEL